jgi:hypothetical protein
MTKVYQTLPDGRVMSYVPCDFSNMDDGIQRFNQNREDEVLDDQDINFHQNIVEILLNSYEQTKRDVLEANLLFDKYFTFFNEHVDQNIGAYSLHRRIFDSISVEILHLTTFTACLSTTISRHQEDSPAIVAIVAIGLDVEECAKLSGFLSTIKEDIILAHQQVSEILYK